MLPREPFTDLLTICASATGAHHRFAATVLLAREMTARLESLGLDCRGSRSAGPPAHFAYEDLEAAPSGGGLDALLYVGAAGTSGRPRYAGGGPHRAGYYMNYPHGSNFVGAVVHNGPLTAVDYGATLADVLALGAELKALVVADMTAPAFDAARAPFVAEFARRDFAARNDFARYAIAGTVAAGASYPLETRNMVVPGFSALLPSDPPQIVVPAPGVYHVRFFGSALSPSTTNPLTLEVALYDGATKDASYTKIRSSSDPTQRVQWFEQESTWAIPTDITVSGLLSVRNGSAVQQEVHGILVIWRDA